MKKRTKVILGIVIVVLVLYSALMTLGMIMLSIENDNILDEYNGFVDTYNNMKERNEDLTFEIKQLKEKRYSDARLMDAAINIISSEAVGGMAENAYIAVIPDNAMNKVNEQQISAALASTDVEYCILTFMGDSAASYSIRIDK